MPIYSEISFSWDKFPGPIGWADAADRDTWFANLHQIVDSISLLSFDQVTPASIESITDHERATVLTTKARVSMKSDIGLAGI